VITEATISQLSKCHLPGQDSLPVLSVSPSDAVFRFGAKKFMVVHKFTLIDLAGDFFLSIFYIHQIAYVFTFFLKKKNADNPSAVHYNLPTGKFQYSTFRT
jgi:hypothetical protein